MIGKRVVIEKTDYDVEEDQHLANGCEGTVVEAYGQLVIVRMDNDPDVNRDGWSFYINQVRFIEEV